MFKRLLCLGIFFFLGLGVFYGGAKFNVPWYGNNDFTQYYLMAEKPFDNKAIAPSAYRILTPTIAHFAHEAGVYHESPARPFKDRFTVFNGNFYDPTMLSAFIFTNFIFYTLSAYFLLQSMVCLEDMQDDKSTFIAVCISSMVFFALPTVIHGMAGLTEGGTSFFISVLLLLYVRKKLFLFVIVLLVSILQRELIPIIMGLYILTLLYVERKQRNVVADYYFVIACLTAFGTYLILRRVVPIRGYEQQLHLSYLVHSILGFRPSIQFLVKSILPNNILWAIVLILIFFEKRVIKKFVPFMTVAFSLTILCLGENMRYDISRILNMATPLLLFSLYHTITAPAVSHNPDVRHKNDPVPVIAN